MWNSVDSSWLKCSPQICYIEILLISFLGSMGQTIVWHWCSTLQLTDLLTKFCFSFYFWVCSPLTFCFTLFKSLDQILIQIRNSYFMLQRFWGYLEWCPTKVLVTLTDFGIEAQVLWLLQISCQMLLGQDLVAGMDFLRRWLYLCCNLHIPCLSIFFWLVKLRLL